MTERLDRALVVACRTLGYTGADETMLEEHRTFARALIADLTSDMDLPDEREHAEWNLCLDELRNRAGIGGE